MRRTVPVLAVAVMLVLAGCSTASSGGDGTATTTPAPTASPSPTPTATPSPTPTPDPGAGMPFDGNPVTITVRDRSSMDVNRTAVIRQAAAYWEANTETYVGYDIKFEFIDHIDADIQLILVDEIEECGSEFDDTNIGCAGKPWGHSQPVDVRVENGYTNESMYRLLRHELGHAVGLGHDDGPSNVMAPNQTATPYSVDMTYSTSVASDYNSRDVREQIEGGTGFIADGSGGTVKSRLTLNEVDNPSDAVVHFELTADRNACPEYAYCVEVNSKCFINQTCDEVDEPAIVVTGAYLQADYIGYVMAYELHNTLWQMGAADEWPEELESDETEPTTTWWE